MTFSDFLRTLPARLARVTTGGKIIKEIDGLRFIAIFLVVVTHLCERFTRNTSIAFTPGMEYDITTFLANRGFMGVHIFFVVSGFVLGLPFASYCLHGTKKVSLRSYFWRRLTRLEPPYIIVITLLAAALVVMGYYSFKEMLPHFLASLVYLHSILYGSWSIIDPPVWSLEIEVQFYTLAPFLALLFFRIKPVLVRRLAFVSFILAWMGLQQYLGIMQNFSRLSPYWSPSLVSGRIYSGRYLPDGMEGRCNETLDLQLSQHPRLCQRNLFLVMGTLLLKSSRVRPLDFSPGVFSFPVNMGEPLCYPSLDYSYRWYVLLHLPDPSASH